MKLPDPVATVTAKAGSLSALHPDLYRAVLLAGGALLILSGLKRDADQGTA